MVKKDIGLYALLAIFAIGGLLIVQKNTTRLAAEYKVENQVATAFNAPKNNYQKITNTEKDTEILSKIAGEKSSSKIPETLRGTLYITHEEKESKKEGENIFEAFLVSFGNVYKVVNISAIPWDERLNGADIEISGLISSEKDGGDGLSISVYIDSKDMQSLATPKRVIKSGPAKSRDASCTGNFCALIIPVDTTGDIASLATPTDIHDYIFTNPGRIKNNLTEQSYGAMNYSGRVTEWVSISGSVNLWSAPTNVVQYILNNSININDYNQIVFLVNGGPQSNGGVATLGPAYFQVGTATYNIAVTRVGFGQYQNNANLVMANGNLSYFDHLFLHETGHNLNAVHDNLLNCYRGPVSMPSECINVEYGNNYSTMGGGALGSHFSFLQKLRIGWVNLSNLTQTISGAAALQKIESPNPTFFGLDYGLDTVPEYVFERRESVGFDTLNLFPSVNLDGILVYRLLPNYSWNSLSTNLMDWDMKLVDTTPGKKSDTWPSALYDAVLKIPQRFNDVQRSRGFRQNAGGANNLVEIYQLPAPSNLCSMKTVKVFEPVGAGDTFSGQVGIQKWPIATISPVPGNIQTLSADVSDPSGEVLVFKQIIIFNNDTIHCSPSQYDFKLKYNGVELPLLSDMSAFYEPWTGPNYQIVSADLPTYGLTYGNKTVTLVVTKVNDGTTFSKNLIFELVP